jgi:microcystin-dependent protein
MPKFVNRLTNASLTSDPTADEGTFYYNSFTDEIKLKTDTGFSAIASQTTTNMPTGSITTWLGSPSSAPSGWLLCDGAAVSRTTYADLFLITSTYFGSGDGSTTFNLPDFRGLSLVGAPSANDGVAVGNTSGGKVWVQGTADPFTSISHSTDTWAHTHSWTDDSAGSHTHAVDHTTTVSFSSATAATGHTHTYTATPSTNGHSHTVGDLGAASGTTSVNTVTSNFEAAAISHTHTAPNVTGGNSHTHTVTESCGTSSGHNHTYTGSTGSYTGTSGSDGSHTHGGTMGSDATASHTHNDHSSNRQRVWYLVKS